MTGVQTCALPIWKKPWKITDFHVAWHAWCGSPNLRRRDDLIMLGRVEKWHNEWNIDRKFTALGFKGVYLNGEYARHLGDNCSRMADRRPDDTKTPYDFLPEELKRNRRAPYINYREMDWIYEYPADVTLVTMALDISRGDRSFEDHYLKGLDKLLSVRNPLVVYTDPKYHEYIIKRRRELSIATSNNRVECRSLTLHDLETRIPFDDIQKIITNENWINQSDWIKNSPLVNRYYVALTLIKNTLLEEIATQNPMGSKRFYWIDSGFYNSFNVVDPITTFDFLKITKENFLLTSYPYHTDKEIHGMDVKYMESVIGKKPEYVCRATLFGGTKEQIMKFNDKYFRLMRKSLDDGHIGTEEALFTMVEMMNPDLVKRYAMPNGDIKNYLISLKKGL